MGSQTVPKEYNMQNLPSTYSSKLHNISLTMLSGSVPVLIFVHPLAGIALMALGFAVLGWTTRDVKVSS